MTKILESIYNMRPYTFIAVVLVGLLAKVSVTRSLSFTFKDLLLGVALISLWAFYNLIIESKHAYTYRAKVNPWGMIITLAIPTIISSIYSLTSFVVIVASLPFIYLYLQKNKNRFFGNTSSITRATIECSYFFFALFFYTNKITTLSLLLALTIFFAMVGRSIVGDLRDIKHNKEAGKKTFAISFGYQVATEGAIFCFLIATLIVTITDVFSVALPLMFFAIALLFYRNGYVMHQLSMITTMFMCINLISYVVGYSLLFINLIYLGIFLNMVFYPLLERKGNPKYKQENKLKFFLLK